MQATGKLRGSRCVRTAILIIGIVTLAALPVGAAGITEEDGARKSGAGGGAAGGGSAEHGAAAGDSGAEDTAGEPGRSQAAGSEDIELSVQVLKGPTGMGMIRMMHEQPEIGSAPDSSDRVNVQYKVVGSPNVVVSRVISGEVDIAALPTNVAAKLYNGGVPYRLAAVHTLGMLYVLTRGVDVKDWSDLTGKTVYSGGRGASPDIIFRHLLRRHGLSPGDDVRLRYAEHTEIASLMLAGRIEVAVLPEPFVTRVLRAGTTDAADTTDAPDPGVRLAMNLQDEWKAVHGPDSLLPIGCLVVRAALSEARPELLRAFLEEYRRSTQWVNDNPTAAGRLIEQYGLGFPADAANEAIPRARITYIPASEARELLEPYYRVLHAFDPKTIGGKLPDSGFYLRQEKVRDR